MDSAEFEIEESSEIDESSSDFGSLGALAPAWREGDAISEEEALETFYEWLADRDIDLWPHQDEALMSLMVGDHVILGTPTGSGKSMVAIGMMFMAMCSGKRAFYTAPIKALVSEKFFGLVNMLGRENVGMITGDSQINPQAPVICCTAEILANQDFVDICDNADDPTDSLQYGQKTVDKLFSLTNAIRTAGIALIALLIFIAFIFINNTIRLAILARRKEIAIMRLVGASNGFIRGPFLAEGALHALIGALLAILVLEIARNLVLPQMAVALPWLPIGVDLGMFLLIYLAMLVAGLVIGLLGSLFAMSRYLKV